MNIKRGEIVLAKLGLVVGSEQGKTRPCLIVQNDIANALGPTTIIVPITSIIPDKDYPTSVIVEPSQTGLRKKSTILCNQIKTISKKYRIIRKLGQAGDETMARVNEALKTSMALE